MNVSLEEAIAGAVLLSSFDHAGDRCLLCAIRVLLHRCARLKQERESLSCSLRILFQARRILVFGESKGILAAPPVLSTVGKFGKW